MKEEKETYEQNMRCHNCGNNYTESFPKGTPCKGPNTCPNCGVYDAHATGLPKSDKTSYWPDRDY